MKKRPAGQEWLPYNMVVFLYGICRVLLPDKPPTTTTQNRKMGGMSQIPLTLVIRNSRKEWGQRGRSY